MRNCILLGAALATAVSATPAAAETQVLDPSSSWTVDYGDEKCSLLRDFGRLDEDGLGLRIDSYGSLSSFRITLVGERIPRPRLKLPVTQIRFALAADAELREMQALTGTVGEYRFVEFPLNFLPPEPQSPQLTSASDVDRELVAEAAEARAPDPSFEAGVQSIMLELRRGQVLQLNTGSMASALTALRTCVDDLRKSWGLDPAQQRGITRFPFPDPESVKDVMADFPRDLAVRGTNGFVPLRVMVDATGLATECIVQVSAAPEQFADAACANIGTRFEPALGPDGQPVSSFYQTGVVYLVRPF